MIFLYGDTKIAKVRIVDIVAFMMMRIRKSFMLMVQMVHLLDIQATFLHTGSRHSAFQRFTENEDYSSYSFIAVVPCVYL